VNQCHAQTTDKLDKEMSKDSTKIYEGKIVKVQFRDKGGRIREGMYSLYFETDSVRLFIKFQEGKVRRKEIEKYTDRKIIVKGYKTFGLWDTDDPNVQSRVGDYIVIHEILK
jgi:hypothetical protein